MFKLKFDTGNIYDGAWHEANWNFHMGYFSTRENAERYVDSLFEEFEKLSREREKIWKQIEHIHDARKPKEEETDEDREYVWRKISPLEKAKSEYIVRREFEVRDHYIIEEITSEMVDNDFDGDMELFKNPWG